LFAFLSIVVPATLFAASVRGVVSDPTGARIRGAGVALVSNGAVVASALSQADGSFQLTTGAAGRYFLVATAANFRQLATPDFYASAFDAVERDLVLEPAWVHESIVVSDTGTPTPQPQTSGATTVIGPLDLALDTSFVSALRQVPGAFVVQNGQRGAATSLFLRGGSSNDTMVVLDGVNAGDLGGHFDLGPLSSTGFESAEIFRGPNTNLYGGDAANGVVSLTTPHGTTSFPSVLFRAEGGNLQTSHQQLQVAGARSKLDYLAAFNWLQTTNNLPRDAYHEATSTANLGWALNSATQLRATAHYGVDATGVPNAWDFYHVADDATEKDQNLYLSGAIENQTTAGFHNSFRYGLTRKREQDHRWTQQGSGTFDAWGDSYGYLVTIAGANGYSASGQALLDYSPSSYYQLVNNRDQFVYQGDVTVTPHLAGLIGFRYEQERGAEPPYYAPVHRTNYEYLASVHGDFKSRFFYTLGGGIEHFELGGLETSPRAGFSFWALRPRKGAFSGTRAFFQFGKGYREPSLTDQFYSLSNFLEQNGGAASIQQLKIQPLSDPAARTWEGGVEQSLLSQHIVFRSNFFHTQFGKQIEYVGLDLVPALLPGLTTAQQNALENLLQSAGAYELSLNSEAYRAMGIETSVESGIGRSLFLRGGYTYLDATVERSFTNSDVALLGPIPTYQGIPVGADSPLVGARPFRRPPHSGYLSATWAGKRVTGVFTSAFTSRSDDSTYLDGYAYGSNPNALLLPNRNLDYGYADLGLGGSFKVFDWLTIEAQAGNLLNNQHMAPIGYRSLPTTIRTGVRIDWGLNSKR
jgi:iron complex outermembrane receptor protein/vitamin B12 transporter